MSPDWSELFKFSICYGSVHILYTLSLLTPNLIAFIWLSPSLISISLPWFCLLQLKTNLYIYLILVESLKDSIIWWHLNFVHHCKQDLSYFFFFFWLLSCLFGSLVCIFLKSQDEATCKGDKSWFRGTHAINIGFFFFPYPGLLFCCFQF